MIEWNTNMDEAPRDGRFVRLRSEQFSPEEVFWWERGKWRTRVFAMCGAVEGWWDDAYEQPTAWASINAPASA